MALRQPWTRLSWRMHLRLWQRLFLAFAALSVFALAGFAAWQQHSFRSGFVGYLDSVALDRLQPATDRLSDAYAEHGNWEFLRRNPRGFRDLIAPRFSPDANDEEASGPRLPVDRGGRREPRGNEFRRARDRHHGAPGYLRRLALVDATGGFVVGNPRIPADAHALTIHLDNSLIGTLRLAKLPYISGATDIAFARAQLRTALVAALVVLIGGIIFAFVLARWLLAPVRELTGATRALAGGDYSRRIDATRRDEIGSLATDFNNLAASLERHREARRRWGADIAHELRTPLSILRGEIQALQDGVRKPTPQAFDSLNAECERLGSLIEDLYQLALADAGALEYRFEPVGLADIVREAIDLQRSACTDAGLTIEEDLDDVPPVRGDARRLTQLIDNLLGNSRRYTDVPGIVRISLVREGEMALVRIEDTPPGVPDQALPRLFDRLYRVEDSRNRAGGGAGLGLAICRAIVAAHGGQIDASPSSLGGLSISVRIPLQAERD